MADIIKNDDIAGDATGLLETQLKGKEKVEALLTSLVLPMQDAEDDIFDIRNGSKLDNATGDMLDQWGALVGISRQGRGDSEYLRLIKAKIAINISKGTINEVADIFNLLTGSNYTEVYELFPREVSLFTWADLGAVFSSAEVPFAYYGSFVGAGYGVGAYGTDIVFDASYLYSVMDDVLCAGYRIGDITYLDADLVPFAYLGSGIGSGYGVGSYTTIL